MTTFWYLATPYTKYPLGRELAFVHARGQAAFLIRRGINVFCPIVHGHSLDRDLRVPTAEAHDFWMVIDRPYMRAAAGLIVCEMEGWEESVGVAEEIRIFEAANKPIVHMAPFEVPAGILPGVPTPFRAEYRLGTAP